MKLFFYCQIYKIYFLGSHQILDLAYKKGGVDRFWLVDWVWCEPDMTSSRRRSSASHFSNSMPPLYIIKMTNRNATIIFSSSYVYRVNLVRLSSFVSSFFFCFFFVRHLLRFFWQLTNSESSSLPPPGGLAPSQFCDINHYRICPIILTSVQSKIKTIVRSLHNYFQRAPSPLWFSIYLIWNQIHPKCSLNIYIVVPVTKTDSGSVVNGPTISLVNSRDSWFVRFFCYGKTAL